MERGDALDDLAPLYGEVVRLVEAGHDHDSIAAQLDVASESVPVLLEIAEAKLARRLREG